MNNPIFKFAVRDDLKDKVELFLPQQGEPYSSGYDVRAAPFDRQDIILQPFQYFKIPLGFRSLCPPGWFYYLHPRSSTLAKKKCHSLIGVVDESWEGETLFAGQYIPDQNNTNNLIIKFGEPIAQIIPIPRHQMIVQSISNDEIVDQFDQRNYSRKDGGFGSTSKAT